MKIRKTGLLLAAGCLSLMLLTGCSPEDTKNYKQAAFDLEQGNYEIALEEYETAIAAGVKVAQSYRGAGVAQMKLGNYEDAITNFTNALNSDKVGKNLKKDILSYRAAAYLKIKAYEEALADCQALAESYDMNADIYFLTGETALAMDSYEEAASNFEQAYGEDATYDRAIQIYGAYLDKDMEADGTRYLEAALSGTAKNAQDHCDRGRVYYYMDDYDNAAELWHCLEWYIWSRATARMQELCSSSMYHRQTMERRDSTGLRCVISKRETMTVRFLIYPAEFMWQKVKSCRACCLMRLQFMRRNWIFRLHCRKRKNIWICIRKIRL